jgi:hypothetical protein
MRVPPVVLKTKFPVVHLSHEIWGLSRALINPASYFFAVFLFVAPLAAISPK